MDTLTAVGAERMNGSEAVVAGLRSQGVRTVFGIPGVHTQHLYASLPRDGSLRHILVRHEQGAGFAAIGAARASGQPGVLLTTPGPGALNAATPLAQAHADSTPIMLIMAEEERPLLYRDVGFLHEIKHQQQLFSGLTQWNTQVQSPAAIPPAIREGFRLMRERRPRPVAIEVPHDVHLADGHVEAAGPSVPRPPGGDQQDLERAARMLAEAERPLLWAGGGVMTGAAWEPFQRLAERLDAPVLTSTTAKGVMPHEHRLHIGSLFNFGPIQRLMADSDVMLAVGSAFGASPTRKWSMPVGQKLIQIDIDPRQPGKNYPVELGVCADAGPALESILDALGPGDGQNDAWVARARNERAQVYAYMNDHAAFEMDLVRELRAGIPEDAIVVGDPHIVGYWCRPFMPFSKPRKWIYGMTGCALGYSYPVALGAKAVMPDVPVVALAGDGGFLFTGQELATAVRHDLAVVAVVFDDSAYGVIKQGMQNLYGESFEVDLANPDYVAYARSFGVRAQRCRPEELAATVGRAIAEGGPAMIHVPLNPRRPLEMD